MPSLGPAEILVILVVALLVFGPNKMPEIGRQVARGVREFRRVQQHLSSELQSVVADLDPTAPARRARAATRFPACRRETSPTRRPPTHPPRPRRPRPAGPPVRAPTRPTPSARPTRSRRTGRPVPAVNRHPRHPRKPPDPSGAAPQTIHSRRPDDGRRAPDGTAHATHPVVGRGGDRGDDLLHLRPRHHLVPHPVLQGLDRRARRQADLHRPPRRVRDPPEDRHLRRHRARDAGVALAALALHHTRASTPPRSATRSRSSSRRCSCSRCGAVVALLTLEPALHFLLNIGGSDLQPLLTADKYISLVSLMIVAFGISFEFPVVLVFLLIAHVLTTEQLRHWRRYAGADRAVRRGHHAEPGSLLTVRDGSTHVRVLRGVHPDRKVPEAMSPPKRRGTSSRPATAESS